MDPGSAGGMGYSAVQGRLAEEDNTTHPVVCGWMLSPQRPTAPLRPFVLPTISYGSHPIPLLAAPPVIFWMLSPQRPTVPPRPFPHRLSLTPLALCCASADKNHAKGAEEAFKRITEADRVRAMTTPRGK